MSGQPFTLDPLQAGATPPPKPAAPSRAAAPAQTFTIDPTQIGNPPDGKPAGNAGATAPSGTFALDPQDLTANNPPPAPQPKPPTQPNEEEIKKKYGLPATANLSKEFLDESNRDVKDPVAFSQDYQEMHPPKPRAPGFFSNVAQETKDIVKGMLSEPAGAVPSTDVSGALETSQSLKDAATSVRQGKIGEAALHATEAVPMIGQPVAARIRQAQTGDTKGALGAALVDALLTALGVRGMLEGETPSTGAAAETIQPETALARPVAGNLPAAPEVKALPPGPRVPREAIGEGLQSNIGPGEKPIPLPERTPKTIPPSGKPIAVGPTTIDPRELTKGRPRKAATAAPAETKAPTATDLKLQIKTLDNQYRALNDRLVNTRKFEVSHKITAKQRVLAAKIKELRAQLDQIEPRPEAKPLSQPEPAEERIGPRIGGAKTYQQERTAKTEAAPAAPKQSKTPTYDRLPPEMREAVDSLTAAHSHLPQMLREANEADMRKLSESGTSRKEQYARLVAKEAGIEPEPKNTGNNVADLLKSLGGEKPEAKPLNKPPEEPKPAEGADQRTPIGERRLIDEGLPAGSAERRLAERRAAVQTGASPVMRRAIVDEAQKIINDPTASADAKRIAKERIADIQAHPKEVSEPIDMNKVRAEGEEARKKAGQAPLPRTGTTLPGMETAVREQASAAARHQGEELTKEIARPLSNIDERASTMERESPLFRDTEASGQKGLFAAKEKPSAPAGMTREERLAGEREARDRAERIRDARLSPTESLLGKGNTLHFGVDPAMVRDLYERLNRAYQEHIADPAIEKLGLGRTHKDVEAVDPKLASRIRRYEAAPQYFRTKAEDIAKSVTDGLTREQERLFSLMADQQSRENLQSNHPREYAQALADKDVQAALARYKPYGEALTKAHAILGGAVMPGDHLPWVYPEHVSGMGQRVAETDTGGGGFDRGVTPQRADQFGRTTTAEYHYKNGLHEFGPAFARKFSRTLTKLAEHATAMDFLSKATAIEPGDRLPPMITYNGKRFYSPEVLQMIRDAKPGKASHALGQSLGVRTLPQPKNAEAYAQYRPTGGKTTPTYLGPRPVVQALKGLADSDPGRMDPVGRFLQEQVIGMGFGVRHGFNLFRRIAHTFPLGTSSPVNWIRAVRVMTDRGLKERALARTNDPAYDALLRWGAISPEGVGSWKEYQGGNLNPANWLRTFAKVGNRWLFEPGGVDQKARLWMRDLLKSQRPDLTDEKAAQLIRDQLGNYSRQNWTKNQKLLSHLLLFPGWDFSTINWVIRHPIRTAVPPAILVMLANQAIHRSGGKQEPGDEFDPFAIHAGGHAYGTPGLEEPLARATLKPFGRAVQARLEGQTGRQAVAEGVRAVPQALAGVAGMTRPDLAMPFEVAAGKTRFGRDIVPQGDFTRRGTVFPNKGAEDIGAHILKAFFPPLERATEESQSSADALLSNFGLNRYQEPSRRPPPSERQQDVYNVKDDIRALERQAAAIAADQSLSADEKQRRLLPLRRKYQELMQHDRPQ